MFGIQIYDLYYITTIYYWNFGKTCSAVMHVKFVLMTLTDKYTIPVKGLYFIATVQY